MPKGTGAANFSNPRVSFSHVYPYPLQQKDNSGAKMCYCRECKSQWTLRAGTIQSTIKPLSPVSLNMLLAQTYPSFRQVNAIRLQQEETIRRDPSQLDTRTRLTLISEPFPVLDNDLKQRSDTLDGRSRATLGIGFVAVLGFAVSSTQSFLNGDNEWGFGLSAMAVVVAYALYSIFAHFKVVVMRTLIYPRLARCLAPLNPSPAELKTAMSSIRCRCAKQTRLDEFLAVLFEARTAIQAAQRVAVPVIRQ